MGTAHAQRIYNQAELDSMLAPIALQADGVVSQILIAATYPEQVLKRRAGRAPTRTFPATRRARGAKRAMGSCGQALVAFPDLLARMGESPQWLRDLGEAFLNQEVQVMDTVQALRQRAQAAGHLSSNNQYVVYPQGEAIVVYPRTHYVYVNYYDPYMVYGPWWWPYYPPVFWRPWAPRPVFVAHGFFYTKPDWHHRHVQVVHKPVHVHNHHVTGQMAAAEARRGEALRSGAGISAPADRAAAQHAGRKRLLEPETRNSSRRARRSPRRGSRRAATGSSRSTAARDSR